MDLTLKYVVFKSYATVRSLNCYQISTEYIQYLFTRLTMHRCERDDSICSRFSYCGVRDTYQVCLAIDGVACVTQLDCADAKGIGTFFCNKGRCTPVDDLGGYCITDTDCGRILR